MTRKVALAHSRCRGTVSARVIACVQLGSGPTNMSQHLPSCSHGLTLVHALARHLQLNLLWLLPCGPVLRCPTRGEVEFNPIAMQVVAFADGWVGGCWCLIYSNNPPPPIHMS